MADISKIDKNMSLSGERSGDEIIYRDPKKGLFGIYGTEALCEPGYRRFSREEKSYIDKINEGCGYLSTHSSGIQIRFRTDSNKIFIRGEIDERFNMNNETLVGGSGMSLYVYDESRREYVLHEVLRYPICDTSFDLNISNFKDRIDRKYILYLPLYAGVKSLEIGLLEGATICDNPFSNKKRIAIYGTSITQGCSASHPGMSYPNIISRLLDAEVLNYGFSGSAFLEEEMAMILRTKNVDCLLIDAEPNAGCDERLENNLYPFLRTYLESCPKTKVLIASRTLFALDNYDFERVELRKFYKGFQRKCVDYFNGLGYDFSFIDGEKIIKGNFSEHSADGVHPDNYAMLMIAKRYIKELLKVL